MKATQRPRRRAWAAAGTAALAAVVLSGCGNGGGQALAQQACVHVKQSIHDYSLSNVAGTPASTVSDLRVRADAQLRQALPLAAQANSADGSWNALMTTISESATVDMPHLEPSLKALCVVADTNVNVNPQNVNPQ
jgi:hypothetical protein